MTTQPKTLPFDVQKIRQDFPILQQDHHDGVPLIFLDNAASSQKPIQVIDAISHYYLNYHELIQHDSNYLKQYLKRYLIQDLKYLMNL